MEYFFIYALLHDPKMARGIIREGTTGTSCPISAHDTIVSNISYRQDVTKIVQVWCASIHVSGLNHFPSREYHRQCLITRDIKNLIVD